MAGWIIRHAPDLQVELESDKIKVTPTYKRLRREYDAALFRAIEERPGDGYQLVFYRQDGDFVFRWEAHV